MRNAFATYAGIDPLEKPRQPNASFERLQADASIALDTYRRIGRSLSQLFTGSARNFEERPEKQKARILQKVAVGYQGDFSRNLDYCAGRCLLKNIDQIRAAIDLFYKPGDVLLPDGSSLRVVDVDNTFSFPSAKKPGLRNLDVKFVLPITREDGFKTYHIVEHQFSPQQAQPYYKRSHAAYEEERKARFCLAQMEEKMLNSESALLSKGLSKAYRRLEELRQRAAEERWQVNQAVIADLPWLNELIGYLPPKTEKADVNTAQARRIGAFARELSPSNQ